jgi:hypothetical protein
MSSIHVSIEAVWGEVISVEDASDKAIADEVVLIVCELFVIFFIKSNIVLK